ncbi:MAG: hypothetical protein R2867_42195 [Caldilineaceae bacterium]
MMTPFATLDGHRIAQFPCPRELRDAVADTIAGELGVNCVGGDSVMGSLFSSWTHQKRSCWRPPHNWLSILKRYSK